MKMCIRDRGDAMEELCRQARDDDRLTLTGKNRWVVNSALYIHQCGLDVYKRQVKDYLLETQDGRHISDYKTEKAYMFYKAFHDFLRRCGAEMIKIDNQSMVNRFYKGLAPVGEIARSYHDGMEASVGEHFDNAMINCMGMASEDMWNLSLIHI